MAKMGSVSTGGKRFVGIVSVVTGEHKARLTFLPSSKKPDQKLPNGSLKMDVPLDELPDHPRIKPNDKSGKEYRVRLSADGKEVEAFTPVKGRFKAVAVQLGPRDGKDADPVPEEKQFKPEDEPYLEFWASYKFTEGPFKGVETPVLRLHYKFMEDPTNEGFAAFKGDFNNTKATRLQQLKEWGIAHGIWKWKRDEEGGYIDCPLIAWDDVTILPELERRVLKAGKEVYLTFDNGYPVRIDPLDDNPYEDEDEDEEDAVVEDDDDLDEDEKFEKDFPEPEPKPAPKKTKVVETKAAKSVAKKVKPADDDDDL
jgi:hypothetical protein